MYKFVYLNCEFDYDMILYSQESIKLGFVYASMPPAMRLKGIKRLLFCLHNSYRLNQRIKLPFRGVWSHEVLDGEIKKEIKKDDKVCFIVRGSGFLWNKMGAFDYLRRAYPQCKIAYFFSDTVASNESRYGLTMNDLSDFDLIYTYNEVDAKKYSLALTPPKINDFRGIDLESTLPSSDVFFVGREKGRYDALISLFEICKSKGLKCDFHILGVPHSKRKYEDEINYDKEMAYKEVLQHSAASRAIVNIIQEGAQGLTLRDYEAIGLNKYLITNNVTIKSTKMFVEDSVIWIANIEEELTKLIRGDEPTWQIPSEYSALSYYNWLVDLLWQDGEVLTK